MKNTILFLLLILTVGFTACKKDAEPKPNPTPVVMTWEQIKEKMRVAATRTIGMDSKVEVDLFTKGKDFLLANQELVRLIEKAAPTQFTALPGAEWPIFVWETKFQAQDYKVAIFDAGPNRVGFQVKEMNGQSATLKAALYWD